MRQMATGLTTGILIPSLSNVKPMSIHPKCHCNRRIYEITSLSNLLLSLPFSRHPPKEANYGNNHKNDKERRPGPIGQLPRARTWMMPSVYHRGTHHQYPNYGYNQQPFDRATNARHGLTLPRFDGESDIKQL